MIRLNRIELTENSNFSDLVRKNINLFRKPVRHERENSSGGAILDAVSQLTEKQKILLRDYLVVRYNDRVKPGAETRQLNQKKQVFLNSLSLDLRIKFRDIIAETNSHLNKPWSNFSDPYLNLLFTFGLTTGYFKANPLSPELCMAFDRPNYITPVVNTDIDSLAAPTAGIQNDSVDESHPSENNNLLIEEKKQEPVQHEITKQNDISIEQVEPNNIANTRGQELAQLGFFQKSPKSSATRMKHGAHSEEKIATSLPEKDLEIEPSQQKKTSIYRLTRVITDVYELIEIAGSNPVLRDFAYSINVMSLQIITQDNVDSNKRQSKQDDELDSVSFGPA